MKSGEWCGCGCVWGCVCVLRLPRCRSQLEPSGGTSVTFLPCTSLALRPLAVLLCSLASFVCSCPYTSLAEPPSAARGSSPHTGRRRVISLCLHVAIPPGAPPPPSAPTWTGAESAAEPASRAFVSRCSSVESLVPGSQVYLA